ncbi:hypothetical protein DNTS_009389 [Danionella cerebrum]|uniref:PWWP domain-containing protein n=1 Tax=Danionella cerebrum TaxID=2873325 RepID=A0A553PX70_9TELE|nr:hypothetical protein DNTS_009389 [Danionella translucida]
MEELCAGARVPVTVEQMVNDTLVVTLRYREKSFTGILLDSRRPTGLFCLPDVVGKSDKSLVFSEEASPKSVISQTHKPTDENTEPKANPPEPESNLPVPVPINPGMQTYPPYFDGAPFPLPIWVRHTYNQWVPQPPPRPIKRKKRRGRDAARLTMSSIRLRPRQVLCEKCKNTLNSDEDSKPTRKEDALQGDEDIKATAAKRKEDGDSNNKEGKRREDLYDGKRFRKDKKDEAKVVIPHSPVIKISYSTPQGKGEVMKIPSRVHGSVKPFCPKQLLENGHGEKEDSQKHSQSTMDAAIHSGLTISIPKLKLPRLTPMNESPKIRVKSQIDPEIEQQSIYEAEMVNGAQGKSPRTPIPRSDDKNPLHIWSGNERHGDLTLLINFRKRKADSSSLSVCSSDSLDESKSFSSDGTSPELCDLAPGDDLSVSSSSSTSSQGESKTVPPLTVRLHTRSMTKCVTEEGYAVTIGDVVWGKIQGFPWWPAQILSISEVDAPWPQAKVSWFGSPTTSQLSVAKLAPFRELFRLRFNRRKKGIYRRAVLEAAGALGHTSAEISSLMQHCET